MPDISELNKLLAEALESINEESLVEKIMSKKRARKLRAARRAKLKQQAAQEKEKENDVIDAEVVDSEGEKQLPALVENPESIMEENKKKTNQEEEQKDYTEEFKQFIKDFHGMLGKYDEMWKKAMSIWEKAGKDSPCPEEAYKLFKQAIEGCSNEIKNLAEQTLPQLQDKMSVEELQYLEYQLTALDSFLDKRGKAIESIKPQESFEIAGVDPNTALSTDTKSAEVTDTKQSSTINKSTSLDNKKRNKTDLMTYAIFSKDGTHQIWENLINNAKKLGMMQFPQFLESLKNGVGDWFQDRIWGFINSKVVTDFIKTLAYSNPLTAFIYDGNLGSFGFKDGLDKLKSNMQKKRAERDIALQDKKDKNSYNKLGLPKSVSNKSLNQLKNEFYGNKALIDLTNLAYNHVKVDQKDKATLVRCIRELSKLLASKDGRDKAAKTLQEQIDTLNKICEYMDWNDPSIVGKLISALNKALGKKGNTDKEKADIEELSKKSQEKYDNTLVGNIQSDIKHGDSDSKILDTYKKYDKKYIEKHIKRAKKLLNNKDNAHESYNITKNLNKLLEDSRSIKENKMNLTSLDEIKQDGLTVFMPSGIQATLFLEDDNVLVQYPNLQVDKYTKKDFQNIMDEGIFIFNDMPQNFPQIMESYDLISKGSGYVEIKIPHELTYDIAQSGDNGEDVKAALKDPRIRKQFDKYDNKTIDLCFEELGIDDAEAFTREDKERFILWDLAWTLVEKEDMDESVLMESEEPELDTYQFTFIAQTDEDVLVTDVMDGREFELSATSNIDKELLHDELEEQMDIFVAPELCEYTITGTEIVGFKYDEETKTGSFEFNIFYELDSEEFEESLNETLKDKIQKIINDKKLGYYIVKDDGHLVGVEVSGDWKHDHAYFNMLMRNNGINLTDEESIDDEDLGGDSYKSIHYFAESINENGLFKKELTPLPSKDASFKEGDIVTINGIKGEIIKVKPMKMSDTCTYQIKLEDGKTIWRYEEEINESLNEELKEEVDPSKLKIKEITKKEWDETPNDYKLEKDGQKYILYLDGETQATVLGLCKIIDESLNEDANSIATELRNGNKSGTDKELGQWKLKTSLDSNWENLTELVKTLILFNIADEVENGNLEMKDFAQYFDNSMDLTKEDLQSLDMFTDEEIDTMFSTNGYLECFITYEIQHLEDPSEDIEESLIDKLSKKGIIRESLVKEFKENNFQAYDKSWYVIGMDGEQAGPFDCYQEAEEYIEEVTGGDEQLRADYSVISADEMEESLNEEDEIKYYWGKTDQNKTLLVAGKSSEDAITNSKKFFTPELVFNSPEECDKEYDEIIDLKENIEEEKTLDFLGINQNDFTSKEELIKYIEENTDYDVLSSGDYWLNIIDRTQNDGEAIQINLERKMREAYEKTKRKEGDVFKALKNKKKEYLTPEFKTELLNSLDRIAREFPNVKVRQQAVTFMDELGLQEYYDTKKIKDFIKKNLEVLNAKVNESLDEGKKQEQFKEKDKKKKKKKLDELNKEVNKMEELKEDCYKVYNSIENRECGTFNSWNEVEDFLNKEWGDYKASMAKENPEFGTDDDKYNFFGNYDMVTTQLPVAVVPAEIEVDVEATPEPVAEPVPEEPVIPQVCPDCGNEPCSCEKETCELCVEEPENCDGCADIEVPEDAEEIDMDAIIDEMCMTKLPDPKKVLDKDEKQEKKNKKEEDKNEDFKDNMGMLTDINDLDFPDALQNAVDTKEDGSLYRISDVAKMVSELKAEIDSLKSEFKTALDELKQGIKDDVKDIRTDVTSKLDNTDDKISELTAEEEDLEALEEPIEEEPTEESAEETEEPTQEENTEDEELEEALKEMRKNPIYSQIKETFESNAHPKKLISIATVAQKIRENYGTDIKNDFTYELIKNICTMAPEFKEHVVDAETEKRTLKESMLGKAAKWISGGLMGILAQEKENKNKALIESYRKEAVEKAEKQNEDANEIKKEIDKLNAEGKNDKIKATIDVMSDTPEEKEEAIDYAIQKVQESNANDLLRRLKNTSRTAAFSNLNIKG